MIIVFTFDFTCRALFFFFFFSGDVENWDLSIGWIAASFQDLSTKIRLQLWPWKTNYDRFPSAPSEHGKHARRLSLCSGVRSWGTNFAEIRFMCNSSVKIRWQEVHAIPVSSTSSSIVRRRSSRMIWWIFITFPSVVSDDASRHTDSGRCCKQQPSGGSLYYKRPAF
jgi:hypothetical protein